MYVRVGGVSRLEMLSSLLALTLSFTTNNYIKTKLVER